MGGDPRWAALLSAQAADLLSGLALPGPLLQLLGRGAPFGAGCTRPAFGESQSPQPGWPGPANPYRDGEALDPTRLLHGQNVSTGLALGYNEIRNLLLGLTQPRHPDSWLALQYFRFGRGLARALAGLASCGLSVAEWDAIWLRFFKGQAPRTVDASEVTYTPGRPPDWDNLPRWVQAALDELAARVRALEAITPQPQVYSCPAGAAVLDAVYLSAPGTVDVADATDPTKMPSIGFIATKPTATTCVLQDEDELAGFAGLLPTERYWIAAAGGISTTPPGPGGVEQQAGFAKTSGILKIELGVPPEIQL